MAVFQSQITIPSGGSQVPLFSGAASNSAQVNIRNTGSNTVLLGPQQYLAPPLNLVVAPLVGGGSFVSGTFNWQITALNGFGETIASLEQSGVLANSGSASLTWTAVSGATGYKIYRAATSGGEHTSPALVTTIGSGATVSYTDTGTAVSAGATPATNTAVIPALYPLNAGEILKSPVNPNDILIAQVQTPGTGGQITILSMGSAD